MRKQYCDILTNRYNSVLYTGVTGDLKKRVFQHHEKMVGGFTNWYNVNKLVFLK